MSGVVLPPCRTENTRPSEQVKQAGVWSVKYGAKHQLQRVNAFPPGIIAPMRVRIYARAGHYVLQWWDPAAKGNLSDRVDGDLVAAIVRARQIEERLAHFKSSGQMRHRRLSHTELVTKFLADQRRRADAEEISPATVTRYETALRHYTTYSEQPAVAKAYPYASGVNREFCLGLTAFLANRSITPNGRPGSTAHRMKGQAFVLDTVRALYEWAADPGRGGLFPEGFRNPFLRPAASRSILQGDPLAEPDITLPMAVQLIAACDRYQLRLFGPMLLFGLRAAEPCFLFTEYLEPDCLRVPCNPDLDYRTKGRRDKRFPLLEDLRPLWEELRQGRLDGLLFERRPVAEGHEGVSLRGASLTDVTAEYRRRCAATKSTDVAGRLLLRNAVLRDAGGMTYDHVQGEFDALARSLGWPKQATLKDLRHLFATAMNNAAMPDGYRRYLMGHAPDKATVVTYTHLNELQRHYAEAVRREWTPLIETINRRAAIVAAASSA